MIEAPKFTSIGIGVELSKSLLKGHIQSADLAFLLRRPLDVVDGLPTSDSVRTGTRVVIVVAIVNSLQFLQLFHYGHRLLVQERIWGHFLFLQ